MPKSQDLHLITAVIDAAYGESSDRSCALGVVTRRLFELVDGGERNFETLKAVALELKRDRIGDETLKTG